MKRMVRRVMETATPVLGIMIILSSVLLNPDVNVQLHVTVLLFGVPDSPHRATLEAHASAPTE